MRSRYDQSSRTSNTVPARHDRRAQDRRLLRDALDEPHAQRSVTRVDERDVVRRRFVHVVDNESQRLPERGEDGFDGRGRGRGRFVEEGQAGEREEEGKVVVAVSLNGEAGWGEIWDW